MSVMRTELLFLLLSCFTIQFGECIRCYQCRSDEVASCGSIEWGSSNGGAVPQIVECNDYHTANTISCFKSVTHVAGRYVTVRGCAPFHEATVPTFVQQSMAGAYWKGGDSFSLCAHGLCNSSSKFQMSGLLLVAVFLANKLF